jgi:exopolyphosphatase/guanosine-5'-triphosphate,3'-diphosphate pyrophosphatase
MSPSPAAQQSPLYAVIDLGSNSFHMSITRLLADSVQVVDKIKRKVRLASGLGKDNKLDEPAINRGLECLSFFAERLQDIPSENIRVVATAALRIATNADTFLSLAEQILCQNVTVLSGQQEAELIYLGVAHTTHVSKSSAKQRLVIDIGGASTEIIIGEDFQVKQTRSLDMGCVTYQGCYFSDGLLNQRNFEQAIDAAKDMLSPVTSQYTGLGWQAVLGGSGTMQALAEILRSQKLPCVITLAFMRQVQDQLIACQSLDKIQISGLESERIPVIAGGLAILIALFEHLSIKQLQLSSGALREGLLYEMLPDMRKISIRQRTINSVSQRFHIDTQHSSLIHEQANVIASSFGISKSNDLQLLQTACALHEVGLLLAYKHHAQHAAYIIQHADLPGFDHEEQQLLVALTRLYKGDIDLTLLKALSITDYQSIVLLLASLRLAVILCRRRRDDVLPDYQAGFYESNINLCLPKKWLNAHPLIADELQQEKRSLEVLDITLCITC